MPQIVFVDLETTGLDSRCHGILEIGALFCDKEGQLTSTYSSDVNPGWVDIDDRALEVNGFTDERIQQGTDLTTVLTEFNSRVEGQALLAGWNIPFDEGFLREAYRNCGMMWPFDYHTLDVWSLFQTLKLAGVVEGHLRLKALVERYGLKQEGDGEAHSAMADITWTYRLWQWALERLSK